MSEGEFMCPACSAYHNEDLWLVQGKFFCSWHCGFSNYSQKR